MRHLAAAAAAQPIRDHNCTGKEGSESEHWDIDPEMHDEAAGQSDGGDVLRQAVEGLFDDSNNADGDRWIPESGGMDFLGSKRGSAEVNFLRRVFEHWAWCSNREQGKVGWVQTHFDGGPGLEL